MDTNAVDKPPPETTATETNPADDDEDDEEENGEQGVVSTLNQPSSDLSVINAPNPSVMSDAADATATATASTTASTNGATVADDAASAVDETKKRKTSAATVKGLMKQNKIVATTNGGGDEVVSTTYNATSARATDEAEDGADAGAESASVGTNSKPRKRAATSNAEDAANSKKRRKPPKTPSDWTVDAVNTNDAEIHAKLASGEMRLFLWSLVSSQKESKKMIASYSSNPEMGIAFPSVCGLEPYIRHSTAAPLPMTGAQFSKLIKPQNALLEHYSSLQKSGSPEAHAIRAAIWYADLRTEVEFDAGEVPKKTILALLCCQITDAPSGTEPLALMIVERALVHAMWKDESLLSTQMQTVPVSLRGLLARHAGFQDKKVSLKVLLDRKCKGLTTKIDLAQFGQAVETAEVEADDEAGASDGDADGEGDGDADADADADALDGDGDDDAAEGDGANNKEDGAPEGDDGVAEPSGGSVSTTATAPLASRRPLPQPQTYPGPAQEIQMSYKRPFDWTLPIPLDPNFESVHVTISFSKPKRARSA